MNIAEIFARALTANSGAEAPTVLLTDETLPFSMEDLIEVDTPDAAQEEVAICICRDLPDTPRPRVSPDLRVIDTPPDVEAVADDDGADAAPIPEINNEHAVVRESQTAVNIGVVPAAVPLPATAPELTHRQEGGKEKRPVVDALFVKQALAEQPRLSAEKLVVSPPYPVQDVEPRHSAPRLKERTFVYDAFVPKPTDAEPTRQTIRSMSEVSSEPSVQNTAKDVSSEARPELLLRAPDKNPAISRPVRVIEALPMTAILGAAEVFERTPLRHVAAPVLQPPQLKPGNAVINQVSTALIQASDGKFELRLDPPELGHVRISVTHSDTVLTAQITTEKPEISEFLRRNAEVLAKELARAGFEGATLDFSNRGAGYGAAFEGAAAEDLDEVSFVEGDLGRVSPQPVNLQLDGLDIRL